MKVILKEINIVKNIVENFSKNKLKISIDDMKIKIETEFMLGNIDINEKEFLSNYIKFLNDINNISDNKTKTKILYNYTYDYVNEDINNIINYDNITTIDGITALSKLKRNGYDDEYIESQKEVLRNIKIMRGDDLNKFSDFLFIRTKDLYTNDELWISLFEKINMFKISAELNNINFNEIFNRVFYNLIKDFILSIKYFKENTTDNYTQYFYHIKDGNIKIHTYNYITDILTRLNNLITIEINKYEINYKKINFYLNSTELIINFLESFNFSDKDDIDINIIDFILDEKLDIYWEEEKEGKEGKTMVTKSRNVSTALIEQIINVSKDIYSNLVTVINKKDITFYNTLYRISKKLQKYKEGYQNNNVDIVLSNKMIKLLNQINPEDKNLVLNDIDFFNNIIKDFNSKNIKDSKDELLNTLKFFIKIYKKNKEESITKVVIEKVDKILDKEDIQNIKDEEIRKNKDKLVKLMKDLVDGKVKIEKINTIINENKDVVKRIQEIDNLEVTYDISSNNTMISEVNKLEKYFRTKYKFRFYD